MSPESVVPDPATRARLESLARREFAALDDVVYLDHALRGPVPQRSLDAVGRSIEACARGALARDEHARVLEDARVHVARVIGADPGEIAFLQNATAATATIAQGIRWRPGDRVVTNAGEYASNVLPWTALEARGVSVDIVPTRDGRLELEDVARHLVGARMLTVAAVSIKTGERRDLAALGALAREHGALFVVDVAPAAGVLALDLRALGVDFAVTSSRKFLLGPPEVGVLYVRRERLDDLQVTSGGVGSRIDFHAPIRDATWKPDARRFEGGALAAPLLAGLAASTSLLLEVGMRRVEALALDAAETVASTLSAHATRLVPSRLASPIVRFQPKRPWTERSLLAAGVVARVEPSGAVRLSPHFWTDPDRVRAVAWP